MDTGTDGNIDSDLYGDGYAYVDTGADGYAYSDAYGDSYAYVDTGADGHSDRNTDRYAYGNG